MWELGVEIHQSRPSGIIGGTLETPISSELSCLQGPMAMKTASCDADLHLQLRLCNGHDAALMGL